VGTCLIGCPSNGPVAETAAAKSVMRIFFIVEVSLTAVSILIHARHLQILQNSCDGSLFDEIVNRMMIETDKRSPSPQPSCSG